MCDAYPAKQFLSTCNVRRFYMLAYVSRWGADRQPLPVQDGGRGVGHPGSISHRLGWEGLTVPKVGRVVLPGPDVEKKTQSRRRRPY